MCKNSYINEMYKMQFSNMTFSAMCAALSALLTRNFSKIFLRARRALEFSHGLDPKRKRRDERRGYGKNSRTFARSWRGLYGLLT